jgi:uncharacterized protein YgiM (DUF1202 family)
MILVLGGNKINGGISMREYNKDFNKKNNGHQNQDGPSATNIEQKPKNENRDNETPNESKSKKQIVGAVANCKKLNVRKAASKDAEVICIIDEGTKVTIIPDYEERFDTDKWAKVKLANGVSGYIMVEFLKEV